MAVLEEQNLHHMQRYGPGRESTVATLDMGTAAGTKSEVSALRIHLVRSPAAAATYCLFRMRTGIEE